MTVPPVLPCTFSGFLSLLNQFFQSQRDLRIWIENNFTGENENFINNQELIHLVSGCFARKLLCKEVSGVGSVCLGKLPF